MHSVLLLRRRPRAFFAVALLIALAPALPAQHTFWVPFPVPNQPSRASMVKVVDYRKEALAIDLAGTRISFFSGSLFMKDAFEFADGQVFANQARGTILDFDYYQEFQFRMVVRPDRDLDDVYAVIHFSTLDGKSVFMAHEVKPMKAGRAQQIHFRGRLNVLLDQGIFTAYLFSNGMELYQVPTEAKLKSKKPHPIPARSRGSLEPAIGAIANKPMPIAIAEAVANESATFSFMVADSGYGYDFRALDAANEVAEAAALSLLKASRYIPGAEDGFFVAKPMVARIDFDARGGYRFESPSAAPEEDLGF